MASDQDFAVVSPHGFFVSATDCRPTALLHTDANTRARKAMIDLDGYWAFGYIAKYSAMRR
jgi:hypothetical protein